MFFQKASHLLFVGPQVKAVIEKDYGKGCIANVSSVHYPTRPPFFRSRPKHYGAIGRCAAGPLCKAAAAFPSMAILDRANCGSHIVKITTKKCWLSDGHI